jgi:hypothetical protein
MIADDAKCVVQMAYYSVHEATLPRSLDVCYG